MCGDAHEPRGRTSVAGVWLGSDGFALARPFTVKYMHRSMAMGRRWKGGNRAPAKAAEEAPRMRSDGGEVRGAFGLGIAGFLHAAGERTAG